MKSKELSKPRNFVAKNSKMGMGGAGAHKDKKKAMKQGDVKHKKKDLPESLENRLAKKVQEYIEQGVAEDTIRPNLVAALKGLGFKGPFKLGQLPEWMAELQDAQFDEETSIMIGGDDPAYDPWVAKGYGYGYAYGMEGGYQTELSAQQVFKQAKGDMEGMAEGRKDYGYDDAGFSLRPGHDEGEPVYNPRYDRTGQYDRKSKYSQDYNYKTGKPLGAAKPAQKKGYIFYNVNDPQTAIKLGLKQTKSGKWYLPADDTHRQATADKVFGKGRYWEPK